MDQNIVLIIFCVITAIIVSGLWVPLLVIGIIATTIFIFGWWTILIYFVLLMIGAVVEHAKNLSDPEYPYHKKDGK